MNREIETLINNLEGCIGVFDYMLTPTENNLLLAHINDLQQENNQLKEMQCTYLGTGCKRANYILKELRSWLEEEIKHLEHSRYVSFNEFGERKLYFYKEALSKLNELEEGN